MKIVFFVLLTFLSGCATSPTQMEIAMAHYGEYPEKYQEIIKQYMDTRLKDPLSATYTWQMEPKKMWVGGGLYGERQFGWGTCVLINAKNSFGGYTGAKRHFFLIEDGKITRTETIEEFTEKLCAI